MSFKEYSNRLATMTTIPELEAECRLRRKVCAEQDDLLTKMRTGELVAINWDVVAESRVRLRLAERALAKFVADQLRLLDEMHYQILCPWWSPTPVKS